jgi:biotin transport system substrate-specific component
MNALTKRITTWGVSPAAARAAVRALAIIGFAFATAVAAQIRVPLPGNPVPLTLQTAVVLLAGMRLGARDGALSQALYLGCGALGLPFFAGAAGAAVLFGPTGGYLLGFVIAAYAAGAIGSSRSFFRAWLIAFAASLLVFVPGVIQLQWFMGLSWTQALAMGVVPFILGDLVKVTLAATTHALVPRKR